MIDDAVLRDNLQPMVCALADAGLDVLAWVDDPGPLPDTVSAQQALDIGFGYGYLHAAADAEGITGRALFERLSQHELLPTR